MIHSLSGGVLDGDGYHTIVKVNVDYQGEKRVGYYICDEFRVAAGDKVIGLIYGSKEKREKLLKNYKCGSSVKQIADERLTYFIIRFIMSLPHQSINKNHTHILSR